MNQRKGGMMLVLFAAIALAGIVAILLIVVNESNKANDERKSNQESIEVLGALTCERAERIAAHKSPVVKADLDKLGFVRISGSCQRFVTLLDSGLTYKDGKVQYKGAP